MGRNWVKNGFFQKGSNCELTRPHNVLPRMPALILVSCLSLNTHSQQPHVTLIPSPATYVCLARVVNKNLPEGLICSPRWRTIQFWFVKKVDHFA